MSKSISRINSHLIFGVISLILFSGQTYIFITMTFQNILKPFAELPQIHSFVQEAIWDVWLRMLIWPILLFVLLLATIIRMKISRESDR